MGMFKDFSIKKSNEEGTSYLIRIEDDCGGSIQLTACFDDLDLIAEQVGAHLDAMVQAAAQREMSAYWQME